jgi:hypothetical protein
MPAFLSKQISARSYGITDKGGSMGPKRNKHPLLYFCWLDANSHSFLGMSCAHCCEDPMVTFVSVSLHSKNPTKLVGLVQSLYHYHLVNDITEK